MEIIKNYIIINNDDSTVTEGHISDSDIYTRACILVFCHGKIEISNPLLSNTCINIIQRMTNLKQALVSTRDCLKFKRNMYRFRFLEV